MSEPKMPSMKEPEATELSEDRKVEILSSEDFILMRNTVQEQADQLLFNVSVLKPTPELVEKYVVATVNAVDTQLAYRGGVEKEAIREMLTARLSDLLKKGEGDSELILKTLEVLKAGSPGAKQKGNAAA